MKFGLLSSVVPFYAAAGEGNGGGDDAATGTDDQATGGAGEAGDATDTGDGADDTGSDAGAAGDTAAASGDKGKDGEGDKPKKGDWRDKVIDRRTAQVHAERTRAQELENENKRLKELLEAGAKAPAAGANGDAGRTEQPLTQPRRSEYGSKEEFDAAVERVATERAQASQLERDTADMETKGSKDYGGAKWNEAKINLKTLGGFDPQSFNAIMATDDPAKVIYELGSNPETYNRIMDLPIARRANEFAKLAIAAKPKPQPSNAPKPVDQIGARGSTDNTELRDDLPEEEWRRRRLAEKAKSVGRPWSRRGHAA